MGSRKRVVDAPHTKRSAPQVQAIRVLVLVDDEAADCVGVRAEADVTINDVLQTLVSGALWGIDDAEKEYIAEIAEEEWTDLRKILTSIGVSTTQLPAKVEA